MLRIVFMGTPDFAVPTLNAIIRRGHEITAVYTQPPRPAGRGMSKRCSPVQKQAQTHGMEVRTPVSLKPRHEQEAFAALGADVAVVVAYGLILPPAVLRAPAHGCLNLHASRLPRWRGAAPIQRAIMAGDDKTAATVMRMDEGLDTGPICLMEPVAIGTRMTGGELHDRLADTGAALMIKALDAIAHGRLDCTPQKQMGVTYAAKIDKAEMQIDFSRPAWEVHNLIRALSPSPGAWFALVGYGSKPQRVKVLASECVQVDGAPGEVLDDRLCVACGQGAVRLLKLQREGKTLITAADFLRGRPIAAGCLLV